jgi:hypothetical protein
MVVVQPGADAVSVSFLFPSALWLLLLLVPATLWIGRTRSRVHLALRALLIATVVLALAQPMLLRDDGSARQVIVLDQRDWLGVAAKEAARAALAAVLARADRDDRLSVVQIGGARAVADDIEWTGLPADAGLAAALMAAQAAIAPGERGSITAIADPRDRTAEWADARTVIAHRSIPLSFVALDGDSGSPRIASASAKPGAAGSPASVDVVLMGTGDDVVVELRRAGSIVRRSQPVALNGMRTLTLTLDRREPAFETLEVALSGARAGAATPVTIAGDDPLRVALVRSGGAAPLQRLLGPGFAVDALSPGDLGDAAGFDLVMLDDLPLSRLPTAGQSRLRAAIAQQGKGLLFAGGPDAFAKPPPGAPLAVALPIVPEGKREIEKPSVALAIVIDSSGSMRGKLLQMAKQTARLAVARLTPQDQVGVVEFYGARQWAVPMQYARDTDGIKRAIGRMEAQGSSILYPAIQEALFALKRTEARYKHILVISDAGVEEGRYEELIRFVATDKINLSTVLVGNDPEGEERMVDWARWGRGRYYAVRDEFSLVQVDFARPETKLAPGWRSGPFAVRADPAVGWWSGTPAGRIPPVDGYAPGKLRPGAQALARVDGNAPLLASWQFGAGRVTMLAADPLGQGTARWRGWSGYGEWLARVLVGTAQRTESLSLEAVRQGANAVVTVQRPSGSDMDARLRAAAQGEPLQDVVLTRSGPGLFTATIPADPARELLVEADGAGSRTARRIVLPPAQGRGPADRVLPLADLADETGGVVVSAGDDQPPSPTSTGASERATALWQLLSALALLLYLFDIAWRRFPRRRRDL